MADTKISALTGVSAVAAANEFGLNEAGTSKKASAAQLKTFMQTPTAPTIASVGAEFSSTGTPTATLPGTHAANDILVLIIQTSNEAFTTPAGYTRAGPANGIGTAVTAGATKLFVFWKRDGGSEAAPTLSDSGDHTYGVMIAVRGCNTTGDPFTLGGQAWKFATSTTGTGPTSVTDGGNRLIMDIFAHHVDQAGGNSSGETNADLTSLTEQFDDSTTDGTGGGIVVITGIKAAAGPVAATTITWATTSADVSTRLQFVPADDVPAIMSRPPEIQNFIGSASDLDDTWNKPTGARCVFAQILDGGGGGSGGQSAATAAGGGGGGGGGYDEAWFRADDLGATVTVHAGKGGAAGTALNQAGNPGVVSEFDKGNLGPLTSTRRITGTAATAAASGDGGNGGCGSGAGTTSPTVLTGRVDHFGNATAANRSANFRVGGAGGSGTTAPVGGGNADWGGGGGESGGDTDAAITAINNGWSLRGGGGGSGGRTNTNISQPGHGGGATSTFAAQGATGAASTKLPYGGAGGVGGGSSVVTGGTGGFPGGGGGGGAGVAGGFGGGGGHGMVVVTTYF